MRWLRRIMERLSTDDLKFYLCYLFIPMLMGCSLGSAVTYLIIRHIVQAQ